MALLEVRGNRVREERGRPSLRYRCDAGWGLAQNRHQFSVTFGNSLRDLKLDFGPFSSLLAQTVTGTVDVLRAVVVQVSRLEGLNEFERQYTSWVGVVASRAPAFSTYLRLLNDVGHNHPR